MADLFILPSTRYDPALSSQDRRRAQRGLNTIIEEELDPRESRGPQDHHIPIQIQQQTQITRQTKPQTTPNETADGFRNRRNDMRIQAWLSPMSDQFPTPKGFPTPRGTHFLEVPIFPSSPSSSGADQEDSQDDETGSESSFSNSNSNPWYQRDSIMTDSTEFDEMYDTSDDEANRRRHHRRSRNGGGGVGGALPTIPSRTSSLQRQSAIRIKAIVPPSPRQPTTPRAPLPKLSIPTAAASTAGGPRQDEIDIKKITSPIAPTPTLSATIPPNAVMFMQSQQNADIPSAPPSLDGSLTSEQMAQMSAPPTPVMGNDEDERVDDEWTGVQLQPGALATLHALAGSERSFQEDDDLHHHHQQENQVIEIPEEHPAVPEMEMQQQGLRLVTSFSSHLRQRLGGGSASAIAAPTSPMTASRASFASLSRLDIPSPGGFFADLSPRTRRTWDAPFDVAPPTSTTAEQFYKVPWNREEAPAMPLPPPPSRAQKQQQQQASLMEIVASASPLVAASPRVDVPAPSASPSLSCTTGSDLVEQFVEIKDDIIDEDDMPTARPVVAPTPKTATFESSGSTAATVPQTSEDDVVAKEIVGECDPAYARMQQQVALANLDRTELWLVAQDAYLKRVISPDVVGVSKPEAGPSAPLKDDHDDLSCASQASTPPMPSAESSTAITTPATATTTPEKAKKKTVRFSETIEMTNIPCKLPSLLTKHESAYYRAFQDYIIRARAQDVFVARTTRFEALQAQRVSLSSAHRNQLLGKYQLSVVPQSAKKRLSTNVARGDDVIVEDPEKLRREKEAEAFSQMAVSLWHVAAMKMLNGGKLIMAPVGRKLMRLSMRAGVDPKNKPRILDLGGQAVCDWAWHVSLQYPNAKIYTVTTKSIRQLSNCNVRGPPNHRQVSVDKLTRLPFADAHFDLVSARELHSILKYTGENGEDEWETCLRECMRVLKPGGYLDFSLLDSDIMKAGKLGLAKSVEFGFTLSRLGYDPSPTKLFLSRLSRAGFVSVHRNWTFLPLGPRPAPTPTTRSSSSTLSDVRTHRLQAIVPTPTGSSGSIAPVTGLVASWSWERWLLRCEMEKVAGELRLADTVTEGEAVCEAGKCLGDVAAVVEEGRGCGAGWRMLSGFARKPVEDGDDGVIRIGLA